MKEVFATERREGPSHAEVTFFFGAHKDITDVIGLHPLLHGTDYYCPEAPLWTPQLLHTYQNVSDGTMNPHDAIAHIHSSSLQFAFETLEALYDTKVRIAFVDTDRSSATDDELHFVKPVSLLQPARNQEGEVILQTDKRFAVTIQTHWGLHEQMETYLARRDDRIVFNMLSMAHEIGRDPQWKSQRPRMLVHLGISHADLPRMLKDVGNLHSTALYQQKWEYPTRILEIKHLLQGTNEVPLETKARYWLHNLLYAAYHEGFPAVTSFAWQQQIFELTDRYSTADIEQLFTQLNTNPNPSVRALFDPSILPWTEILEKTIRNDANVYMKSKQMIPLPGSMISI